eukprot:3497177-Rhodomonas_salina.1
MLLSVTSLVFLQVKGDKVALLSIFGVMDDPGKDQYGHLAVQVSALRALQIIAAQETRLNPESCPRRLDATLSSDRTNATTRDTFSPRTEAKMFSSIVDKITSPVRCSFLSSHPPPECSN